MFEKERSQALTSLMFDPILGSSLFLRTKEVFGFDTEILSVRGRLITLMFEATSVYSSNLNQLMFSLELISSSRESSTFSSFKVLSDKLKMSSFSWS